MFLLLLLVAIPLFLYYLGTRSFKFWENANIIYAKPIPFFGNIKDFIFGRKHITLIYDDIYKNFPKEPYIGIYELTAPNLLIRDPELAHNILVKDFSYFHDRGSHTNEDLDPLSAHLVNLAGRKWKATRAKLMPAFAPSKLKQMYPLVEDCIQELETHLESYATGEQPVDMKEVMAKFSTDVIGRCAFGLDCNTLRDPNAEFRRIGRKIFAFTYRIMVRIILRLVSPKLLTVVRVKMMSPDVEAFFFNMLHDTIKYKKLEGEHRADFLQLMIDIQDQEKNSEVQEEVAFSDTLLVANMFVFFAGGFETTASSLACCVYELAINPEIQNKLRTEIETAQNKEDLNYDTINELPYLEMVICEALRKYVPIPFPTRVCNEDYVIPSTQVLLKKGTRVTIPVYSYHMDPNYFPNPEEFKPDRFANANKTSRVYMPFGDGPRICIGLRLAKLEMKCCLARLLLKYSFSPCDQTEIPIKMNPRSIFFTPKGGIMLKVKKINS